MGQNQIRALNGIGCNTDNVSLLNPFHANHRSCRVVGPPMGLWFFPVRSHEVISHDHVVVP
jgi:hypothetical protein